MRLERSGGVRDALIRSARFGRAIVLSLGIAICFVPGTTQAIDRSLCNDDGITEVPPFATRDSNGCLVIDPGNGSAPVPFQYEFFHKHGTASCDKVSGKHDEINLKITGEGCPTKGSGQYCSLLVWDTTIDNYLEPGCKNEDVVFLSDYGHEVIYFKNFKVMNGWACKGGGGWTGPNGLSCAPGEDSGAHSDGMQIRATPANDGWVIMQDGVFVNGFNLHLLYQENTSYGSTGSAVFQGLEFGRRQAIGGATKWVDDCKARRATSNDDICPDGRSNIGTELREAWFINVWGTSTISLDAVRQKIVVVNTGCGRSGCGGTIAYRNGWPHPINRPGVGPGTCPDGQIGSTPPTYCYRSLERAAAAGHKLPPFTKNSPAGWAATPPSGGSGGGSTARPAPPVLEP